MKKLVTITLMIAFMGAAANADAILDYTTVDLGGGWFQYKFTVSADDGTDRSFAIQNLTFQGNIQQTTTVGFQGNQQQIAGMIPDPYDIDRDTWVYDGWDPNPPNINMPLGLAGMMVPGPPTGADVVLSLGSGTTQYYQQKDVIQVVAIGDVTWDGTIFRNQLTYPTSGSTAGPGLDSIQILTPVTDDHPGGPYPTWNTVNIPAFGDTGQGNPPYGFAVTVDLSNVGAGVASYLVSLSIDGGTTFAPLQAVQDDASPDGDGAADGTLDVFLSFAQLAAGGADDRTNATPYYIRVEAMDDTVVAGGGSPTGEVSEIEIRIPEPATMGLMLFGAIGVLARKRRRS